VQAAIHKKGNVMSRNTVTWGAAAGLAAMLSVATIYAQPAGGPGHGGRGMRGLHGMVLGHIGRELGVTDAQREQIKTIMESHKPELQSITTRGVEARKALHEAVSAEPFDEQAIRERAAAVAAVDADGAVLRAKVRSEIFQQVLTAEQREKAKTLRGKFEERMRERHDRMRQRRDGAGQPPGR
jgi:protein CpxP